MEREDEPDEDRQKPTRGNRIFEVTLAAE
jgi:hypothetical protein